MSFLTEKIPPILIEDNYYKFRRLGIDEVSDIIGIVCKLVTDGYDRLAMRATFIRELATSGMTVDEEGNFDPNQMQAYMGWLTMALGVEDIKDKFKEFIVKTLYKSDESGSLRGDNVTHAEISNPELFPAYSVAYLALFLVLHPDFELLKNAVEEGTKLPFFRQASENLTKKVNENLTEMAQSFVDTQS